MTVIVQKFGGTSLATDDGRRHAARKVAAARARGDRVAVVVSAMGRRGDPYATDTLLDLVREEAGDPDRLPSPRTLDLLLACGEVIAAAVFAATLRRVGIEAAVLSAAEAGIHTDGRHGEAEVVRVEADRLRAALAAYGVAVVPGFQGIGPDGSVTTLGRGGSDVTAAVLAAALGAARIELYKDVDGVKAADPRRDPRAPTLPRLSYGAMLAWARAGARVVHPRAVEWAARHGIPIWVRSTFGDDPGTLIGDDDPAAPVGGEADPRQPLAAGRRDRAGG